MSIKKYLTKGAADYLDYAAQLELRHLTGQTSYDGEKEEKGYIYSYGFTPETRRYAFQEWKNMKDRNVYVVNYPKTGNNWVHELTRRLVYKHDEEHLKISEQLSPTMTYVEFGESKKYDIFDELPLDRIVFRTNLPRELFDMEKVKKKKGKVIYVIRNPKDQAVSWYYFAQSPIFTRFPHTVDWNDFLEEYMAGKHHLWTKEGEWYLDNLVSWWKYKDDKDVLFIHYEDVKKDPGRELSRIASFLDVEVTEEEVEKIIEACSFDAMQKRMPKPAKIFTRKGSVGGWKTHFTVAQSEKMDRIIEEKLAGTGINFTYTI